MESDVLNENDEFGYVRFDRLKDSQPFRNFSFKSELDSLSNSIDNQSSITDAQVATRLGTNSTFLEISRILATNLSAYYDLLPLTYTVMHAMAEHSKHIEVYGFCHLYGRQVSKEPLCEIYAIKTNGSDAFYNVLEKVTQFSVGRNEIPRLMLGGIIASYDTFLAALLRIVFQRKPEILASTGVSLNSEEAMAVKDILEIPSMIGEKKIEALLQGSHLDQIKYLDEIMNNEMRTKYSRFKEYIEIFERRNLFAHSEGIVNQRYIEKCKAVNLIIPNTELGRRLSIDPDYLSMSLDVLIDAGLRLFFVCWYKLEKDVGGIMTGINDICLTLIRRNHSRAAAWVLQGLLERFGKDCSPNSRKITIVNLANAYFKSEMPEEAEKTLKLEVWDSSSENFRLCVAAVRGDADATLEPLAMAKISGNIDLDKIQDWPAFDRVRGESLFINKVEELFGESPTRKKFDPETSSPKLTDEKLVSPTSAAPS